MKKSLVIGASILALVTSLSVAGSAEAASVAKAGGTCATAGAKTTIAAKSYTCVKAMSGKLVWTLSTSAATGAGAKPAIAGGHDGPDGNGGPSDEGSAADLARHAAMKKYSDCIVAHGGTAMTFGGPGGPRGAGAPGAGGQPGSFPTPSAAQQKAMTACASLAPKFGGPHGAGGFRPSPSSSSSASN